MTEHTTEELPSTPDDMRHTALTITGWREDECRHSPQVASNAFQALSRRINAWGDEFEVQAQEVIALRKERDLQRMTEAKLRARVKMLTKQKQKIALQALSNAGQAADAYEAQLKAEARVKVLEEALGQIAEYPIGDHPMSEAIPLSGLAVTARQALKGDQP